MEFHDRFSCGESVPWMSNTELEKKVLSPVAYGRRSRGCPVWIAERDGPAIEELACAWMANDELA